MSFTGSLACGVWAVLQLKWPAWAPVAAWHVAMCGHELCRVCAGAAILALIFPGLCLDSEAATLYGGALACWACLSCPSVVGNCITATGCMLQ